MRFGYGFPVFGGWLRNVPDERMPASWDYVRRLAQRSEALGYDLTLVAELNLNDIKGVDAPSLDAWSTASCDAYLMHGDPPERVAAKIADMRARRERWGGPPLRFGVAGYVVCRDTDAEAKRELARITTLRAGAPGFENFGQWVSGTRLEQRLRLEDYSVSNRGLRAGLAGTPEQIAERIDQFERAGVELLLLQFSPQLEEMERFAETVLSGAVRAPAHSGAAAKSGH